MSSVLPIAISGLNAATQRFQSAATNIASGDTSEQAAIELMMSKISLEADAQVAKMVAENANRLLDIMA